jgi:hypothetical protein
LVSGIRYQVIGTFSQYQKQSHSKNILGVPAKKSGRAFRYNLFSDEKSLKRISTAIPNANLFLIYELRILILKIL